MSFYQRGSSILNKPNEPGFRLFYIIFFLFEKFENLEFFSQKKKRKPGLKQFLGQKSNDLLVVQ